MDISRESKIKDNALIFFVTIPYNHSSVGSLFTAFYLELKMNRIIKNLNILKILTWLNSFFIPPYSHSSFESLSRAFKFYLGINKSIKKKIINYPLILLVRVSCTRY